jgi:DNA repair protein RadC
MLDTKHRFKRDIKVSRGTLSGTSVDPREVFNAAVREKSAAIVCGHNHPSRDLLPSPEDNALTARLRESGKILEISLIYHVIVGRSDYYSYDEEGWTP